jgi:hypothetical protein
MLKQTNKQNSVMIGKGPCFLDGGKNFSEGYWETKHSMWEMSNITK